MTDAKPLSIAVVMPCYRVAGQVLDVIARIPAEVGLIFCVDDRCPEASGEHIQAAVDDTRVHVIHHEQNLGVGGAVITGYRAALAAGADVVVKIDGDGQMAPELIPQFVAPIATGIADYTKGNRFFAPENLDGMPRTRLLGNALLSFASKLSSGYWRLFDPANGYTAIHRTVLRQLPLEKIAEDYFFESDMLFRLGSLRAVIVDIPMRAVYGDENSSLRMHRLAGSFFARLLRNFAKRLGLNYFLRDFNMGSVYLLASALLIPFGILFGTSHWVQSGVENVPATAGTVMLAALPLYIGVNTLLGFFNYDTAAMPTVPLQATAEVL